MGRNRSRIAELDPHMRSGWFFHATPTHDMDSLRLGRYFGLTVFHAALTHDMDNSP